MAGGVRDQSRTDVTRYEARGNAQEPDGTKVPGRHIPVRDGPPARVGKLRCNGKYLNYRLKCERSRSPCT